MVSVYDPQRQEYTYSDGEKVDFYCGDKISSVGILFLRVAKGELTPMQGYNNFLYLGATGHLDEDGWITKEKP